MTDDGPARSEEMGTFAFIGLAVGVVSLFVSCCSAVNTAFQLEMTLEGSDLPDTWGGVGALAFISVVIIGLSLLGSHMATIYKDPQQAWFKRIGAFSAWPAALALIVLVVWYLTLLKDYGSLFVWHCAKESSVETIQAYLDEGVTPRELDACVWHSAQDERVDLLEPLFAAGANFEARNMPADEGYCAVNAGRSTPYIRKAVELGARPENCPRSEFLILYMGQRTWDLEDEAAAESLKILIDAGWDPNAKPPEDELSALDHFEDAKFAACVRVLEAAGAKRARKRAD